jgi:hypothetical protein
MNNSFGMPHHQSRHFFTTDANNILTVKSCLVRWLASWYSQKKQGDHGIVPKENEQTTYQSPNYIEPEGL